jgi:hypothetical protein
MRTVNKKQDFKNRLKLAGLIIALGLIVLKLTSCGDADEEPSKAEHPPFTEFWFSANVEVESLEDTQFEHVKYFNVWGDIYANDRHNDRYIYTKTSTGAIPSGNALTVTHNGNIVSFIATGTLPRTGIIVPTQYTGDPELWNDNECQYTISVSATKTTQVITDAEVRIFNSKFDVTYDITSKMAIVVDDGKIQFRTDDTTIDSNMPYLTVGLRIDKL